MHLRQPLVLTRSQKPFRSAKESSMPGSTPTSLRRTSSLAENKKAQDRWSKEEEKLLIQLWAKKDD